MTKKGWRTPGNLLDSTLLITLFALLVHLITSPTATHNGLIVSLGIVLASVGFARRPLLGARESGRHVWAVFAALSAGRGHRDDAIDHLELLAIHRRVEHDDVGRILQQEFGGYARQLPRSGRLALRATPKHP